MEQSNRDYTHFTLEFKEETQGFHYNLSIKNRPENTHGWATIAKDVSDDRLKAFRCFLRKEGSTNKKMTVESVKKSYKEFTHFLILLLEHDMALVRKHKIHYLTFEDMI